MTETQRINGGSGNAMNWKRFGLHLGLIFIASLGSSLATWSILSRPAKEISWKKTLDLTPDQEKQFSAMESEFNSALNDIAVQDAQNKISLCSLLPSEKIDSENIDATTKKMAELYQQKQKRIVGSLASISGMLTPEQRKTFSAKLMQEICASCRKTSGADQCMCGMCKMQR